MDGTEPSDPDADVGRVAGRPPAAGPAEWFTVPGRLLLILTVAGAAALFAWYFLVLVDDLPAGSYPVVVFVAPVAVGAVLFFLSAAFVLERIGVRIYQRGRDEP